MVIIDYKGAKNECVRTQNGAATETWNRGSAGKHHRERAMDKCFLLQLSVPALFWFVFSFILPVSLSGAGVETGFLYSMQARPTSMGASVATMMTATTVFYKLRRSKVTVVAVIIAATGAPIDVGRAFIE